MVTKDLISVIVPVYNVSKFINSFLKSVEKIDFEYFEIIFIDDGSSDGSGKILDTFCSKFNKAKVYHIKNGGVSNARNYGISVANGNYFYFIDPDDIVHPDCLKVLYSIIKKDDASVAVANYKSFSEKKNIRIEKLKRYKNISKNKIYLSKNECLSQYLSIYPFFWSLWNKLYKKDLLLKIPFKKYPNLFPLDCFDGDDALFNCYVFATAEKVVYSKKCIYYWRLRKGSIIHTRFGDKNLTLLKNGEFLDTLDKNIYKDSQDYIKSKKCLEAMILIYKFAFSKYKNPEAAKAIYKIFSENLKYCIKAKRSPWYYRYFMWLLKPVSYLVISRKFK